MTSSKFYIATLVAMMAVSASAQIPGSQTAAGIIAASGDGMSRFLARDGPIQPAITAIGGLPIRTTEMVNRGISRISDSMSNGAKSMAQRAGTNGEIKMPGMDTIRQYMPSPVSQMGDMISRGLSYKNSAIMNQARRAVEAADRSASMMSGSVQSVNPLHCRPRPQPANKQDGQPQVPESPTQNGEKPSSQLQDFSKKGQGFRPDLIDDDEGRFDIDDTDDNGQEDDSQIQYGDEPVVKASSSGRRQRRQNRREQNQDDEQEQQQQQFGRNDQRQMDGQNQGRSEQRFGRDGRQRNQREGDNQRFNQENNQDEQQGDQQRFGRRGRRQQNQTPFSFNTNQDDDNQGSGYSRSFSSSFSSSY